MIKTERFFLRELEEKDATVRYLSWFSDPVVTQFIESTPKSLSEIKLFIAEKLQDDNALLLGIFTHDSEHIGNIKFEPITLEKNYAALGILIGQIEWRGKKVSQEVINASCDYLKQKFGITHFCLGVAKENVPAIKAYEKLGFSKSTTDLRDSLYVMDKYL